MWAWTTGKAKKKKIAMKVLSDDLFIVTTELQIRQEKHLKKFLTLCALYRGGGRCKYFRGVEKFRWAIISVTLKQQKRGEGID